MEHAPRSPRDGAARIERALREAADGLTMRELVAATGLHENALRRSLARRAAGGSVSAEPERRESRGRPALRYRLAGAADAPFRAFLPLLLDLLPDSPAGDEDAYALGRRHAEAVPPTAATGAREAVRTSLRALGFAPVEQVVEDPGTAAFLLSECPFSEAVTSSARGTRICALHHGLLAGVAEAGGGELRQFSMRDPRTAPCRVLVAGGSRA